MPFWKITVISSPNWGQSFSAHACNCFFCCSLLWVKILKIMSRILFFFTKTHLLGVSVSCFIETKAAVHSYNPRRALKTILSVNRKCEEGLFSSHDRKCALKLQYFSEVCLFMTQRRITMKPCNALFNTAAFYCGRK